MPDWNMKDWHVGKRMTLLEAFGVSSVKFSFPKFRPELPNVVGQVQHPIAVSSGGSNGPVIDNPSGKVQQTGPIKQYARKLLRDNGWGDQWESFNNLVMHESEWNPKIANPGTGAYGIAQAYKHGSSQTQGTNSDMYGGFGLTDKQAKQANSGDPYTQLLWMTNYIKKVYGSPNAAWGQYFDHPGGVGSY